MEHRSYQAECTSVSFPTDSEHNKYCILLKVSINAGTEIHNEMGQLKLHFWTLIHIKKKKKKELYKLVAFNEGFFLLV